MFNGCEKKKSVKEQILVLSTFCLILYKNNEK